MRMARLFLLIVLFVGEGARADVMEDIRSERAAIERTESVRHEREQHQRQLMDQSRSFASQIDALQREPEGVRRDTRLRALLATAKGNSDELERLSAEERKEGAALQQARRSLVALCDKALAEGPAESVRLELLRLRAGELAQLATPPLPLVVARTASAAPTLLDGPRELEEKADRLRDSEDKLRREAERLARRIDGLERRRQLQERASAIDEDWFSESLSNRRAVRTQGTVDVRGDLTGATNNPAPPIPGGAGSAGGASAGPTRGGESTVLRNLVDPATLAELDRADLSDDFERQTRALRRAKSELERLARELDRRAQSLDQRAAALRKKK